MNEVLLHHLNLNEVITIMSILKEIVISKNVSILTGLLLITNRQYNYSRSIKLKVRMIF